MQLSTLFLSLVLPLLAAAGPITVESGPEASSSLVIRNLATGEPESFKNATLLGVDIFGPMPDDYEVVGEGLNKAEPGSKSWAWLRAQIDMSPEDVPAHRRAEVEKRQSGRSVTVNAYTGYDCFGTNFFSNPTSYNVHYYHSVLRFTSFGIGGRNLGSREQLDFSNFQGNDACGLWIATRTFSPVGCNGQVGRSFACWRLWLN
ncbi:hypothetical protein M0657_012176 [Pyricularia oryzae]|uniref:Uncharacterized protein n=1 Tax=Pyricularia oryzae (strain Y34) TaxID=1143189 RepID=A0AA97PIJ1_PYRO3|nr:hypothetical protein OOU_Y34scaffold00680g1 [Pyricularia oryzae Y34]KAI7908697.1 hypothetical protein M0657_012176 [Pyricularia oryzae]KAI7908855.1 hypothetical protein M9X92_011956 [Pyricularia oryzae]